MAYRITKAVLVAAALSAAAATGCTSGNSAIEPPFTSSNISTLGKLQFAVGTANIAEAPPSSSGGGAFIGLNTVVTFRQANGGSAFAVDEPQIVGPANFVVPSTPDAGSDAGGNTINSTPQTPTLPSSSSPSTTFGLSGQAQLYGFGPGNAGIGGSSGFGVYALPFYASLPSLPSGTISQMPFAGGPSAFSLPSTGGFPGFNEGFTDFAATPVSGTYTLNVTIPVSPGTAQKPFTYTQAATLNAKKVLPTFTEPNIVANADGSVTVELTFPAGVTEAYAEFFAGGSNFTLYYKTPGTQRLPAGTIGSCTGFQVEAVGFDYPAFEANGGNNRSQTPKIVGSAGQDDITVSAPFNGTTAPSTGSSC